MGSDPRHRLSSSHRKAAFAHRGPGIHPCDCCGYRVPWIGRDPDDRRDPKYGMFVAHANGMKGDDRPENLLLLCVWCNTNKWAWEKSERWFFMIRDRVKHLHPVERQSVGSFLMDVVLDAELSGRL